MTLNAYLNYLLLTINVAKIVAGTVTSFRYWLQSKAFEVSAPYLTQSIEKLYETLLTETMCKRHESTITRHFYLKKMLVF